MTEDEAKTKWCPFGRQQALWLQEPDGRPDPRGGAVSRRTDDTPVSRCIGSACMAWRWDVNGPHRIEADAEFKRTGRHKSPTDGYCGLAGTPS